MTTPSTAALLAQLAATRKADEDARYRVALGGGDE